MFRFSEKAYKKMSAGYFVDGKLTIADLSFVTWKRGMPVNCQVIVKGSKGVDVEK